MLVWWYDVEVMVTDLVTIATVIVTITTMVERVFLAIFQCPFRPLRQLENPTGFLVYIYKTEMVWVFAFIFLTNHGNQSMECTCTCKRSFLILLYRGRSSDWDIYIIQGCLLVGWYDVEVVVTSLVTIATAIVTIATRVKRVILSKIVTFSIEMWVLLVYIIKQQRCLYLGLYVAQRAFIRWCE